MVADRVHPRLLLNPGCARASPYPEDLKDLIDENDVRSARRAISAWPGYQATPLRRLHGLAARLGVGRIDYKDEAGRFGLGSFKALGGAYAVERLIRRLVRDRLGLGEFSIAAMREGAAAQVVRSLTVCCATDGNHGRSVAWAAQLFGCRCVIFLHAGVSAGRQAAIERYGAEIRRVPGNYDDSVQAAAETARANGWQVVSDTSYPGYVDIPLDVMAGYTVMSGEVLEQIEETPTHVFLQAGVGGMAAAVAAHLWMSLSERRPRVIVVEPDRADCLFRSAASGRMTKVEGDLDTVMAGLACGEASPVAWEILQGAAAAFMTVSDVEAMAMMRDVARGSHGDCPLVAGESAVAGLGGLAAAARDPRLSEVLGLGQASRVLCFGTEGDTDPEIFLKITGMTGDEVRAAAAAHHRRGSPASH